MAKITKSSSKVSHGLRSGYRSGLEDKVAEQLNVLRIPYEYEPKDGKVEYTKPAKPSKYTPDFTFPKCHIIVETKGRFVTADRQKHLLIKQQHPELDIRFVFSNSKQRLSKISPTTYAMWCEKHGFKYADKYIPDEWINEILLYQQPKGKLK